MATVFIPALLRSYVAGQARVDVEGETVRAVVAALDARYPGLQNRLIDGDDLAAGLAVFIDGQQAALGLAARVSPQSELHFLPAIAGG